MDDKDIKVIEPKVAEKAAKGKNGKEPVSFKKILTVIIISVLALLMVGSAYYIVVAIQQSKAEKANAFGLYKGKPINIEYNNLFYNTVASQEGIAEAQESGNFGVLYNAYYRGYVNQVLYTAIKEMTKDMTVPQELVNRNILAGGYYNGEDGVFSEEIYKQTDNQTKNFLDSYTRMIFPFTTFLSDAQSVLSADGEAEFIASVSKYAKSYAYCVIDSSVLKDSDAVSYVLENGSEEFAGKTKKTVLKDAELLAKAKEEYAQSDAAAQFIENTAKAIAADMSVATKFGLEIKTADNVPLNSGDTAFIACFGEVGAPELEGLGNVEELYEAKAGSVLGPYDFGEDAKIVVKVTAESIFEGAGDDAAYRLSYVASGVPYSDFAYTVFNSGNLEDNFVNIFFNFVMNSGSASDAE